MKNRGGKMSMTYTNETNDKLITSLIKQNCYAAAACVPPLPLVRAACDIWLVMT